MDKTRENIITVILCYGYLNIYKKNVKLTSFFFIWRLNFVFELTWTFGYGFGVWENENDAGIKNLFWAIVEGVIRIMDFLKVR